RASSGRATGIRHRGRPSWWRRWQLSFCRWRSRPPGCWAGGRSMTHSHDIPVDLTRNQELVLGALNGSGGRLSAYDILDRVRGKGIRAPLQVYRALDKLVERGLAHRLESLSAF